MRRPIDSFVVARGLPRHTSFPRLLRYTYRARRQDRCGVIAAVAGQRRRPGLGDRVLVVRVDPESTSLEEEPAGESVVLDVRAVAPARALAPAVELLLAAVVQRVARLVRDEEPAVLVVDVARKPGGLLVERKRVADRNTAGRGCDQRREQCK